MQTVSLGNSTGRPGRNLLERGMHVLVDNSFQLASLRFPCCGKRARLNAELLCNPKEATVKDILKRLGAYFFKKEVVCEMVQNHWV